MFGLFGMNWLALAVAVAVSFAAGAYSGWRHEHEKFVTYQTQVEAQAALAKKQAQMKEAQDEQAAKEVESTYQDRIAKLRRDYERRLHNAKSNTCTLPEAADAARRLNEAAANSDAYLVEQCTETAIQLEELQNWIRKTHPDTPTK